MDRDGDELIDSTAGVAVIDRNRVGLRQGLAIGQELQCGVIDREGPRHLAGAVAGGIVAHDWRESAEIAVAAWRRRYRVAVGEIDVGKVDGAGGGGRQIVFGDGSTGDRSRDGRRVVGAMAMTEFVYDPNSKSNSSLMSLTKGTFTFVAGKIAKSGDMDRREVSGRSADCGSRTQNRR